MSIYLDVFFLVNFFMSLFVLWVSSFFDKEKLRFRSLVLGSFVGTLTMCVSVIYFFNNMVISTILGVLAIGIAVFIAFKTKTVKVFARRFSLVILSGVIVGGGYLFVINISIIKHYFYLLFDKINILYLVLLTLVFYVIIKCFGGVLENAVGMKHHYCKIKVVLKNKSCEIIALKDTGNFLIEDEEGNKIIIAEFNSVRGLFSIENQLLYLAKMDTQEIVKKINTDLKNRITTITFSSLGAEKGDLTAYKLDEAIIFDDKEVMLKKALLVVYNNRLSANGSCNGIINPVIID